jgi:hypothetical protein
MAPSRICGWKSKLSDCGAFVILLGSEWRRHGSVLCTEDARRDRRRAVCQRPIPVAVVPGYQCRHCSSSGAAHPCHLGKTQPFAFRVTAMFRRIEAPQIVIDLNDPRRTFRNSSHALFFPAHLESHPTRLTSLQRLLIQSAFRKNARRVHLVARRVDRSPAARSRCVFRRIWQSNACRP